MKSKSWEMFITNHSQKPFVLQILGRLWCNEETQISRGVQDVNWWYGGRNKLFSKTIRSCIHCQSDWYCITKWLFDCLYCIGR